VSDLCYTKSGIAYAELEDGWTATFTGSSGGTGRRKLKCAWADHVTLMDYLLSANSFTVTGIDFVVGEQHPRYPSLFVDSVTPTPEGKPTGESAWQDAVLDVTYRTLQFDPLDPQVIREDSVSLASEVVPLLRESVQFADESTMDRDAEMLITYLNYRVTLKGVSTVPLAAVYACLNHVSDANLNFKIGTGSSYAISGDQVLYQGIDDIKIAYTAGGAQKFDVTHSFLISPVSLNKEYNPNSTAANVFDRYEDVTPPKFEAANMSALGV